MIKLSPILLLFLFSCKTVKEVVKIETRYDSTAIKENKQLRLFLSEEIERFEKERETWDSLGLTFFEPQPCPDSGKAVVSTVIDFEDGKIKKVKGAVKSINQTNKASDAEKRELLYRLDSTTAELVKEKINIKTVAEIELREVKRNIIPWWIWLVAAGILIVGTYFPSLKRRVLKTIKNI